MCRQLVSMVLVIRQSPGPLGEDMGVMGMLCLQNDTADTE